MGFNKQWMTKLKKTELSGKLLGLYGFILLLSAFFAAAFTVGLFGLIFVLLTCIKFGVRRGVLSAAWSTVAVYVSFYLTGGDLMYVTMSISIYFLIAIILGKSIDTINRQKIALSKSKEQLRDVIENQTEMIVRFLPDGTLTFVNEAYRRCFGGSSQELLGESFMSFLPEDLVEKSKAYMASLDRKNPVITFETKVNIKTHEVRWHQWRIRAFFDNRDKVIEYQAVGRDITERKAAEKALQESEQKYREILATIEEGYYEVDLAGNFVFLNKSLCQMLGYEEGELMYENYKILYKNPEEVFNTYNRVYRTGNPEKAIGWPAITKAGDEIFIEVSVSLRRDEAGNPIGFRGVARDITERKKAEDKIKYLSFHDKLTGLYNRAYLEEEMSRLDSERQLPISIIMADLNDLKLINDTYGHSKGDEMLKKTAEILERSCRKEDIIARWGGDEFVVLLPKTFRNEAQRICDRINENCYEEFIEDLPLSIALGVATKDNIEKDLEVVLKSAEDEVYNQKLAKKQGDNSNILDTLLKTMKTRSYETESHISQMQELAYKIGDKLQLTDSELDRLGLLIKLHDIGNIKVPKEIMEKRKPLTEEEWEIIKKHPETGYKIANATVEFSHIAKEILAHHERWDGNGYPRGLDGEKIPLLSRIVSIVDAYSVMTTGRPYKEPLSTKFAISEIRENAGTQFDPELVKIFMGVLEEDENLGFGF